MVDLKYLQIIKQTFPKISERQIQVFNDGWDYLVLVVNDQITFRFPRSKEYIDKLPVEVRFVNQFIDRCPIAIPKLKLHKKSDILYATYPFIQGVQLEKEVADTFSNEQLMLVAKQLGKFLSVLHSFPLEKAKELKQYNFDPLDAWRKRLEKIKIMVFPLISTQEQEWIKVIYQNYFQVMQKSNIQFCVTHSDIMPGHIIVDPEKHKLSGVIDFGDVLIGDPAYDFTFFGKYGRDFLEKAYLSYTLSRDEYFDVRRQFYQDRYITTNLEHSLVQNDTKKIALHKKQLEDYIQANPR